TLLTLRFSVVFHPGAPNAQVGNWLPTASLFAYPTAAAFPSLFRRPLVGRSSSVIFALLFIGGVEPNPGPIRSSPLKAGLLNVRSAVNKAAVIHDIIDSEGLDVLVLTETWFRKDDPPAILDDLAPEGFRIVHWFRSALGKGKGRGK